jgi:class 3 adenylate cyclase
MRQQVQEPLIAQRHGQIVKLMGDGVLVEFASVVDALTCAVDWQKNVPQREVDGDENKRLEFGIGINLGDVIVEGDDIHEDGVNVAARPEDLDGQDRSPTVNFCQNRDKVETARWPKTSRRGSTELASTSTRRRSLTTVST